MQQPPLKTLPVIFVEVCDLSIIVRGKTRHRCKALGFEGMRFKWDRDRQQWCGPLTLRNLAILDRWPEVELSAEARESMEAFREAAAKRKQYQQQKARA
jgi:hypothetical protein